MDFPLTFREVYSCGQPKSTNSFPAKLDFLRENRVQIQNARGRKRPKNTFRSFSHDIFAVPKIWAK
ncbi:hypothetical protein ARMSODRAFT_674234 [Armillaria solidipes]|uniref:Uncharacterized protein n=1 Tax=Armillaria solidipes TaxID=1076256 RepID=A0A2H3AQR8_9AGAR|nr:hypothetical protein ARMSODRAFT_674234 [Armillaria solidipes]